MTTIALITIVILVQYSYFTFRTGMSRGKNVQAPAVSGDERFERAHRVQINTLEHMAITIPAMWICGTYFNVQAGILLGAAFVVGRAIYSITYMRDPKSRTIGFMIGFFANVALMVCSLIGLVGKLI